MSSRKAQQDGVVCGMGRNNRLEAPVKSRSADGHAAKLPDSILPEALGIIRIDRPHEEMEKAR